MHARTATFALAAAAVVAMTPAASAQECPCNCYFSGDCESGNFCNWGNLSIEDTCFWKTPKPQGQVGAGCTEDFNNWGQCDGICTPTAAASFFTDETPDELVAGVNLWATALNDAAQGGGGVPSGRYVNAIHQIPFNEPQMADGTWRMAAEVLMISRGDDFLVFPDTDLFLSEMVAAKDLSGDAQLLTLGDLAIKTLVAEIREAGAGRAFVDQMGVLGLESRLDAALLQRLCPDGGGALDCIYGRIADMGEAMGRGQVMALGSLCAPECADLTADNTVDVADLLMLLSLFGDVVPDGHAADYDDNNRIDTVDLLALLGDWGPCPDPT